MRKKKSLSEQSLYLALGRSLTLFLNMLNPIILVRVFSKEEYGLYGQLMLIFTTLLPLGQMGLTQGLFYFLPREPDRKDSVLLQTLLLLLLLGGVVLGVLSIFSLPIASLFHNKAMEQYLPLLGIYSFFMIVSSLLETSMIAEGRSRTASVVLVLSQAMHTTTLILAALATRNIRFIMYALLIFSCSRFIVQGVYLKRKYNLSIKNINIHFWKEQLAYSMPIGFGNTAYLLQGRLHSFLISFLFDPSTFAVYSIGCYNLPFLSIVTASVSDVMIPQLSVCQKRGEKERILEIWNNAVRKVNLLLFPIFIFFAFMAEEILTILFTKNYGGSVPIFRINLLNILISGINTGAILSAYAETAYLMRIGFLRLPLTMAIVYVFTNMWGVLGAVSANVLISVGFRLVVLAKVGKVLHYPFRQVIEWGRNAKILLVAFMAGLPLIPIKAFTVGRPLLSILTAAALYPLCFGIFAMISKIIEKTEWVAVMNFLSDKYSRIKLSFS